MVGRQVLDQLADARAELEGEVGRRRPDEGVDVVDRRLGHRRGSLARGRREQPSARRRPMRRVAADAARDGRPLGAQPHGHALHPHARLRAARVRDRALRRAPRDLRRDRARRRADAAARAPRPAARPASPRSRSASTSSSSSTRSTRRPPRRSRWSSARRPIFAALIGLALGSSGCRGRFWSRRVVSFAGVGLVALGAGGEVSGDLARDPARLATAATWAGYSVAIAPLMQRYSPSRISASSSRSAGSRSRSSAAPQTATRTTTSAGRSGRCSSSPRSARSCSRTSSGSASIHRIGASRATLVANLQPFVAAVFALVLLSEQMTRAAGRRRRPDRRRDPARAPAPRAARAGRRRVRSAPWPGTTSCRSTGGITSSSGSATPSRRRSSTSTRSGSRASRTRARRPASATAPPTCSSRARSGSC